MISAHRAIFLVNNLSSATAKTTAPTEPKVGDRDFVGIVYFKYPTRTTKTEGFERLFSHSTSLNSDGLVQYAKDFQVIALMVSL